MLYPLTFHPIFKERIWGGRNLATLYGKPIPDGAIGESWEISDRPGDESVVANGPWRGTTLHQLALRHPGDLFGPGMSPPERFPLLIKILDAQDTLSLQVHPPAGLAPQLGGEPKTEMWYVAQAGPAAELFVGLKGGTTRAEFEKKLAAGTVEECFHRVRVQPGDAMFLPSGRVHALGAQTVIFEVQQNSDTTYRVFDWNRLDATGQGRQLHVEQSLQSIDFADFEPPLLPRATLPAHPGTMRPLVKNELFEVSLRRLFQGDLINLAGDRWRIFGLVEGALDIHFEGESLALTAGQFCLIPARCVAATASTSQGVSFLQIA